MEYFDLSGIQTFLNEAGQPYDTESFGRNWYFETRVKFRYLTRLLAERNGWSVAVNYTEKPNRREGPGNPFSLKPYVIVGFVPDQFEWVGKSIFVKLEFSINDDWNGMIFHTEVDINFKDPDNPYHGDRKRLMDNSRWEMPIDGDFPRNWDSLVERIDSQVIRAHDLLVQFLQSRSR